MENSSIQQPSCDIKISLLEDDDDFNPNQSAEEDSSSEEGKEDEIHDSSIPKINLIFNNEFFDQTDQRQDSEQYCSVNEEQKTPINHNKRFFESYQSISAKKFLQMSGEIKT